MPSLDVYRVRLATGKIVLVREPKISDQEMAAKAAAGRLKTDDKHVLSMGIQQELVKMLVVAVGDKENEPERVSHTHLENLDNIFSVREYMQLATTIQKIIGGDVAEMGNAEFEMSSFGEQ